MVRDLWCFLANLSISQMSKLRPTQRQRFAQDGPDCCHLCPGLSSPWLSQLPCLTLPTLQLPLAAPCSGASSPPALEHLSQLKGEQLVKTTEMELELLASLDPRPPVPTPFTPGALKASWIPSPCHIPSRTPTPKRGLHSLLLSFTSLSDHLL